MSQFIAVSRAIFTTVCIIAVSAQTGSAQEATGSPAKTKVVCFGDSITKRGYSEVLSKTLGVEAINAGVAGNSTAQALRRLSSDVLAHSPDIVVILFGTNDLRADAERVYVPVDKYKSNLESMIAKCRKGGSRIILCTLPPIQHDAFFTRHKREQFDALGGLGKMIESYRQAARQVAAQQKTKLVDLNDLLAKEPKWLSKDGVHPTTNGTAIIAKHIAKAIKSLAPAKNRQDPPQ